MSTNEPSFHPYDIFDYDASLAGNAYDDNDDDDIVLFADNKKEIEEGFITSGVTAKFEASFSSSAINDIMERVEARDRSVIIALHHDVEHRCIVDLLKLLEDSQCPNYMLQSVLQWAYDAKSIGFDFNPRATTRTANVQWMYKALQHSHQRLPQVIALDLEDHDENSRYSVLRLCCCFIVITSGWQTNACGKPCC